MVSKKLVYTTDYSIFEVSSDNRDLTPDEHRSLVESLRKYKFLKSFPLSCVRNAKGRLVVKDGQHRLAIAQSLGLGVWYIEEDVDYDVAFVSMTPKGWKPKDYAQKHARNGHKQYQEGIDFAKDNRVPITLAFALLGGTTTFGNVSVEFMSGAFQIKDRAWAERVVSIYAPMLKIAPKLRNARFLQACMAVCRVPDFDAKRLVKGAERCRERLVPYSTVEGFLELLQDVYNFGRSGLVPLKISAQAAMRSRNIRHNPRQGK